MTYLLQVSTCWILFYGIYLLFLRKETFFMINRYYLIGSLLAGLLIPFLGALIPANGASTEVYQVMSQLSTAEVSPEAQVSHYEGLFTWTTLLIAVYIAGGLVVAARFAYGLYRIYSIYQAADKTKQSTYTLVQSDSYHLPFSFFHYIFISKKLPLTEEVEKVLKHEELHANQWHSLDIIFVEMLQIFFWFNPILIIYKAALRQSHEYLADAYVTQEHNKHSYGQLLLRQSTSGLEIALANQFFHSQIKQRITMMYTEKSKRSAMVKYLAAVPVLVAMLLIFSSNRQADHLKSEISEPTIAFTTDPDNFDGRKIIQRSNVQWVKALRDAKGTITINATANKQGRMIYVEIDEKHTTLEVTEGDRRKALKDMLLVAKEYKIEEGEGNSNGTLIFNLGSSSKMSHDEAISKYMDYGSQSSNVTDKPADGVDQQKLIDGANSLFGLTPLMQSEDITWQQGTDYTVDYENGKAEILNPAMHDQPIQVTFPDQDDPIFKVVEQMPRFPGCEGTASSDQEKKECAQQKMLEYIYKNVKYPTQAKNGNIEGTTVIQFVVRKTGKITDAKIVRDIGGGCGEESLRVVNSFPDFVPGEQRGKKVNVQYVLPIKYKLADDTPKGTSMINVIGHGDHNMTSKKDNLNKTIDPPHIECAEVYKVVEQMPRFPGCEDLVEIDGEQTRKDCAQEKMLQFIYTNVKYPKTAREQGIDGVAVVSMIVDKDGSINDVRILRNPGGGTGEEAKRVVEMMPDWIPGKQGGKEVQVQYTLPIKFKLEGDAEEGKTGNVEKLLKGKQSGVNLQPGESDHEIVLSSTVPDPSQQPLIVINGKVKPNTNLEKVNPNDIEAINVLKGEKAIEKYGSQAENGVIEVTMKEGKAQAKYLIDGQLFGYDFYRSIDKSHIKKEGPASKEDKFMRGIEGELTTVNMLAGYGYNSAYFPGTNTVDGTEAALLAYVANNVKYPQSAIDHEIEGLVTVRYTVQADGSLNDFKIGKSVGWGLDEAVISMMEKLAQEKGPWKAAYLDRRAVASTMVLPVKFKLNNDQKKDTKSSRLEPIKFSVAPNPSDGRFTIDYQLTDDGMASLIFYDYAGSVIKDMNALASTDKISVDLSEAETSVVYVSLQQAGKQKTIKVLLQK